MDFKDQILCPIPGLGHCLYDRCPYWDAARQECDADCLQSKEAEACSPGEGPCTIHWTEDFD
jgi:hypothetical protein